MYIHIPPHYMNDKQKAPDSHPETYVDVLVNKAMETKITKGKLLIEMMKNRDELWRNLHVQVHHEFYQEFAKAEFNTLLQLSFPSEGVSAHEAKDIIFLQGFRTGDPPGVQRELFEMLVKTMMQELSNATGQEMKDEQERYAVFEGICHRLWKYQVHLGALLEDWKKNIENRALYSLRETSSANDTEC